MLPVRRIVLLSLMVGAGACADPPKVSFVDKPMPQARVNEAFEHQLEVKPVVEDARFTSCRVPSLEPAVEVTAEGNVIFTAIKPGPVELCINYSVPGQDERLAQLTATVEVEHPKGMSGAELTLQRDAFKTKVLAAGKAALAVEPKPRACPKDMPGGQAQPYDEADLSKPSYGRSARSLFTSSRSPLFRDFTGRGGKELKDKLDADTSATYLLVVRPQRVEIPEAQGSMNYVPGSYRGQVQVVHLAKAEVRCTFPIDFRSSKGDIAYKNTGVGSAQQAVLADLRKSGRKALRERLKQKAPKVTLQRLR